MGDPKSRDEIMSRLAMRQTWCVSQLAALLDVHISTIYRWIAEGHIKCDRRGPHKTLVPSSEVRDHLERLQEAV